LKAFSLERYVNFILKGSPTKNSTRYFLAWLAQEKAPHAYARIIKCHVCVLVFKTKNVWMLFKKIGPFFKWILETFMDEIFFPNFFSWIVLNIGMHPSSVLVTLLVLGVVEFIFLLIILIDQVIVVKYLSRCWSCCCYYKVKQKVSFQIYNTYISFTTFIVVS